MTQASTVTIGWINRPVHFGLTGTDAKPSVDSKAPRRRIGNIWTNLIYQIARELAFDRFVIEVATVSEIDGETTVELCHTWRIVRGRSGSLACSSWDPLLGQWVPCEPARLPTIPLFSRARADLAHSLIKEACRSLIAFATARVSVRFFSIWDPNDQAKRTLLDDAATFALDILVADRVRQKQKFETLASAGSVAGAAIWKIIDREWISIVARMYQWPTFEHYAQALAHRDAVTVVDVEHRNLLPLLRVLPADLWADASLFAHYRWKDAAKTPLKFIHLRPRPVAQVIASRQAWRALMSAPAPLVAAWTAHVYVAPLRFDLLFEVLARTKVKTSTFWMMRFARALRSHDQLFDHRRPLDERGYSTLARLADCLFLEIRARQAVDGFRDTAEQMTAEDIGDLLDWWAFDGCARNLPDRQTTWASMCRAIAQWEIRREQIRRQLGRPGATTGWVSAITEAHIDGVDVVALDTGAKLIEEGELMHHCVANYIDICARRGQRIFSLRLGELRSTLRIALHANGWTAVENRSQCNGTPDPRLIAAGVAVARLYAEAEEKEKHDE
uniref:PcfJ domain-containing protein n=1 Tax=Burkholderia arboris TaxID=488730 RepID=UPI003BEF102D